MPPMHRCVFDTNVLISALLFTRSAPARALHLARQGTLLLSPESLNELTQVIRRKKFDPYVTIQDREQFLAKLVLDAELVDVYERVVICRDPKDDKFLDVAVNGQATVLVSGDDDLLVLHPFRSIPILTPQQFVQSAP
ncbi:MAG: putative toxin-antitoxin system toxin component, PIN family [Chloroflexales bacterium]